MLKIIAAQEETENQKTENEDEERKDSKKCTPIGVHFLICMLFYCCGFIKPPLIIFWKKL